MYEAFYRLSGPPFRLTPDPRFLFLSAHHHEALGHLLFGIREGTGFINVTGEIGTGKTTLLRALLRELDPNTIVAYIFNPVLSDLELLQSINSEFGLPATSASKKELIDELNRFLLAKKVAGARVVVIVDEAQNLAPMVLEQLRLLSNLETETEKLLQIVLVGQPELRAILGRPDLAQLNQRITVRWHLEPLDRKETGEYVRHRLRIAGGTPATELFTRSALRLIYRYSGGVPRLINIVAHRALLTGFTKEQKTIGAATVRQAIRELRRDDSASSSRRPFLRPAFAAGLVAVALAVVAALAIVPLRQRGSLPAPAPMASASPATGNAALPAVAMRATIESAPSATVNAAAAATPAAPAVALAPTLGGAVAPAATPAPAEPTPIATVAAPPSASPIPDTLDVGAAPQPNATPAQGDVAAFWETLGATDNRAAALTATDDLLGVWSAEPLSADERRKTSVDLWAIAGKRGLRYLPVSGTLERLQLLNLPAILELSVPTSQRRRFAVVTGVDGDHVQLRYGTIAVTLTADEMAHVWLGEAHVFWRDFLNLSAYMAPGSVGEDVMKLQQMLARIGEYQGSFSSSYDRPTSEAIARFQRSRRLVADGVVGPLTKILLYEATGAFDHPRLGNVT
jgi:general secretion pathway protein A